MTSIEFTDPKYFARDVVAFSDAELDQYLEAHRLDGGAMVLEVEDPENLPESFIQRLRNRAQYTSDTDQSRPVDPAQLTSRLLDISSDRTTSSRPPTPPFDREGSAETSSRIPTEELEKRDYDNLVEEGGRPLYSIDLIDEVAKDPFSRWDILRPWVDYPADSDPDPDADSGVNWNVFGRQLWSWRMFRYWQKFNRDDYTGWEDSWHEVRAAYDRFVSVFRRRSPTYTEAVKQLLAEYDFIRPFQFHEDPIQQDKLTTWIEYLGYECWVHHRYASRVKRMQPKYDTAWKTLVDLSVLRPFETEEYVCNIESAFRRQSERDQATQAVASARAAAKAVLTLVFNNLDNRRSSRLTSATRLQMMVAAKSRIEAAEEALASIKRRNELVTVFKQSVGSYLIAKKEAKLQNIRVRWTLEQVPLIEAELNESSIATISPNTVRGVKRSLECDKDNNASHDRIIKKQRRDAGARGPTLGREDGRGVKRSLACDVTDEATYDRFIKKQKRDPSEPGPTLGHKDGPNSQRAKPKRNRDNTTDNEPPSRRLKRRGVDGGSLNVTFDVADVLSAGDSHESGTIEIERPDGGAMRTIERPSSKGSKFSGNHLQRRISTRNAHRARTAIQPLRRSARIAARQDVLQLQTGDSVQRYRKPTPMLATEYGTGNSAFVTHGLARPAVEIPGDRGGRKGVRGRSRRIKSDMGNTKETSSRPPLE
ncbi:unnamed protein product [Discula destructiva]